MNIFVTSVSLILIGLATIHPIFFRVIDKQVIRGEIPRRFLQLNYLVHVFAGGLSIALYWLYGINYRLQVSGLVYLAVIIVVSLFYWNTKLTKWNLFTASVIFGFIIFYRSINEIVEITPLWPGIFTGLLGSTALSITVLLLIESFYRTIVKNNYSIRKRLIKYIIIIIGLRIFWQIIILFNLSVATQYNTTISALRFFWESDPIELLILVITGMVLSSICIFVFRKKIFKTQRPPHWILILIFLISIVTAEILSKYFLLQFGIVL